MTAEHKLPLIAFLALSALCLLVAAAGLGGPASRLPGLPAGPASLVAGAPPAHLVGAILVGRTSAALPLGNDHPVVPSSVALPASAPAGDAVVEPTSVAVHQPVPATRHPRHTRHNRAHHQIRHQSAHRAHRQRLRPGLGAPARHRVAHRPQRAVAQWAARHRVAAHRPPGHATTAHHGNGHRHHHPGRHRGWSHGQR